MLKRIILVVASLILSSAISIRADDIGLLSLTSQAQVERAEAILGQAYGKVSGKFIVVVSEETRRSLARAGMHPEIVLPGADVSDACLVLRPCARPEVSGVDIDRFGRTVDLGQGIRLAQMSRVAASTLSATTEYKAIPLSDNPVGFHFNPPTVSLPGWRQEQYPVDTVADLVQLDSVYAYCTRLEDYYTRYIGTDSINAARDWMVQKFLDWGYTDISTPEFAVQTNLCYNVHVVKPGYAEPDRVIVIGAHYDATTYPQSLPPWECAPGADDNASGTAAVLEAARILADIPLRKTVVFIPFSAEEQGLVGSGLAARNFQAAGTDIEMMYNLDMIGYIEGPSFDLQLLGGRNEVYRDLTAAAAARLTPLTVSIVPVYALSDHYPFYQRGYDIVYAHERVQTPGYHTVNDVSSLLTFTFMTEAVRMSLASVAIVAESPSAPAVSLIDVGDGQALELQWSGCRPEYTYTVYHGDSPGVYTDSAVVAGGACSYVWSGLAEGVPAYFAVAAVTADGYRSLGAVEYSETPLVFPRSPRSPMAESDSALIELSWMENTEVDFAYYNVYRQITGLGSFVLYRSPVAETTMVDTSVMGQIEYSYRITAVDLDGNESAPSEIVSAFAGTFDGGVVIVDAFSEENQYIPDQAAQVAFFDTIMADLPYGLVVLEEISDTLSRSQVGQYSSLIWIDDDPGRKTIDVNTDVLAWYAGYSTNMLVSGYWTIQSWSDSPVPVDHMLYQDFMVSGYTYWGTPDFVGAFGQNGWPSVQIDPIRGLTEWPNIPALQVRPGATVIYTYDSFMDLDFEGEPVGVAYDGPTGKRIALSFPIYYLTPSSSRALMSKVIEYFGEEFVPVDNGDIDGDGRVDIGDLTLMIDYMFMSKLPLSDPNAADIDSDCVIDIGDLTMMIAYLFIGGVDLLPGCVE
ncbi:MAG TPA: M28 family peptidase [Acidobacteriota bacterium]|nr:M28 family peptidase [Acidobacteriota bacterium]